MFVYLFVTKIKLGLINMNDFLRLPPTERACGQVGHLKRLCPNVRRYKLLILNYLQMFKKVSVSRNKSTKGFPKFNNFRQPHLPQTHVDGSVFCPMNCPWAKMLQFSKSSQVAKKLSTCNKTKF